MRKPMIFPLYKAYCYILFIVEQNGLLLIADLKDKSGENLATSLCFNSSDESLLIADTRQRVTHLLLKSNRYNVVCLNLKESPLEVVFIGKQTAQG